ncbi:ABC transporter ATP-binding protein [Roseibium sp.]|uniref:ABC transporter ATP-binding protein n=1 Tax=Roseibium sp. TaxID=1936156 RepID=UPI003A9761FE
MPGSVSTQRLKAEDLTVRFGTQTILPGLSLQIPDRKVTVIVGPNACGKSTFLRSLARLTSPQGGAVLLDGKDIRKQASRQVARTLAILPQIPTAPEGIRVYDLVERGRIPYQSALRQWSARDREAVETALELTGMSDLAERYVQDLSGGQRQRAWIALCLAQETDIVLLDEPTTFLDLPHQIEVLELVRKLNREAGRTVAMVLHDVNLAARYADHMIALKDGTVIAKGAPESVVTADTMRRVFSLECHVMKDPVRGTPMIVPL